MLQLLCQQKAARDHESGKGIEGKSIHVRGVRCVLLRGIGITVLVLDRLSLSLLRSGRRTEFPR
jgi:hypothetical protein